jgi:DNA-binding MarR family transcriptional regulator
MTQADVLKILKRENRWMLVKEIADELGISTGSAACNLNKLYKYGEVFKDEDPKKRFGGLPILWKTKEAPEKRRRKKIEGSHIGK